MLAQLRQVVVVAVRFELVTASGYYWYVYDPSRTWLDRMKVKSISYVISCVCARVSAGHKDAITLSGDCACTLLIAHVHTQRHHE